MQEREENHESSMVKLVLEHIHQNTTNLTQILIMPIKWNHNENVKSQEYQQHQISSTIANANKL